VEYVMAGVSAILIGLGSWNLLKTVKLSERMIRVETLLEVHLKPGVVSDGCEHE